ncbi:helix-turn-helix domain-containing protein [Nocardia tengchongensis]|uniref:helix-turn-helix domain-containing protein n=1 Tax=Nocardia tengchongensis TaxID=2055889 RepID=UPI003683936B
MAGTYSNRTDLLEEFGGLCRRIEQSEPRRSAPSKQRTSGGPKKQLTLKEAAEIVAQYQAGASMAQLKVEHQMAKRTVARVLQEARVTIRPRGGTRIT